MARPRKPKAAARGRFIVLDGPDGAGKSTQVQLLVEHLEKRGIHSLALREPGGTTAGEVIRSLLLERREDRLTPVAETFLFEAARAQLVEEIIRPALARGTWVVCDRFTLSTMVYQGAAGGVDARAIALLSALATGGLRPDLYCVLWVDPQVSSARREHRPADRMEAKGREYQMRVSRAFRRLSRSPGGRRGPYGRLFFLEAGGLVEDVRSKIWAEVEKLLPSAAR